MDRPTGEAALRSTTANLPFRYAGRWEGTVHDRLLGRDYRVSVFIGDNRMGGESIDNRIILGVNQEDCTGFPRLQQVDGETAWFTTGRFQEPDGCPGRVVRLRFDSDTEADVELFETYSPGATPVAAGRVHHCEQSAERPVEC